MKIEKEYQEKLVKQLWKFHNDLDKIRDKLDKDIQDATVALWNLGARLHNDTIAEAERGGEPDPMIEAVVKDFEDEILKRLLKKEDE